MTKKRVRIIERISPLGGKSYIVQQKHFLFRWWWVDAWMNSCSSCSDDSYKTIDEAIANLPLFDGTKPIETVVWEGQP